jgi:hypothetical protein
MHVFNMATLGDARVYCQFHRVNNCRSVWLQALPSRESVHLMKAQWLSDFHYTTSREIKGKGEDEKKKRQRKKKKKT